jgi:hypothetical protein
MARITKFDSDTAIGIIVLAAIVGVLVHYQLYGLAATLACIICNPANVIK